MPRLYDVVLSCSTSKISETPKEGYTEFELSDASGNFMSVSVNYVTQKNGIVQKRHKCKTEPVERYKLWVKNGNTIELRQNESCAINCVYNINTPQNLTLKAYYGTMALAACTGDKLITSLVTSQNMNIPEDAIEYIVADQPYHLALPSGPRAEPSMLSFNSLDSNPILLDETQKDEQELAAIRKDIAGDPQEDALLKELLSIPPRIPTAIQEEPEPEDPGIVITAPRAATPRAPTPIAPEPKAELTRAITPIEPQREPSPPRMIPKLPTPPQTIASATRVVVEPRVNVAPPPVIKNAPKQSKVCTIL